MRKTLYSNPNVPGKSSTRGFAFARILSHFRFLLGAAVVLMLFTGCEKNEDIPSMGTGNANDSYSKVVGPPPPTFPTDSKDFVQGFSNPYLSFTFPKGFYYDKPADSGVVHTAVQVYPDNTTIMGVLCTEIRERIYENGELMSDSRRYYAEDMDGNVWNMGVSVRNYVDGEFSGTTGSWMAGKDGAQPGLLMPMTPANGMRFMVSDAPGTSVKEAQVINMNANVTTDIGSFSNCLKIKEWDPADNGVFEFKYYHPGTGFIFHDFNDKKGTTATVFEIDTWDKEWRDDFDDANE